MEWFYANENSEQVTVTEAELKTLVDGGTVRGETLIWREGMADWQACRTVWPDWFAVSDPALPPAPAQLPGKGVDPAGQNQSPLQPPVYYPPQLPPPTSPTDGLSVASMVLGIVGLVFMACYGAGIPFSIGAVICGHIARNQQKFRDRQAAGSGPGMALAGLITGYIGIGLLVLLVVGVAIMFGFAAVSATSVESVKP